MQAPKYTIEFIGSYFLVLSLVLATVFGHGGDFGPIAVGLVLLAMSLSGSHLSGGHFNPVITLAAFMQKKISQTDAGWYAGLQLVAGAAGAFTAMAMNPRQKDLVQAVNFNFDAQAIPVILGEFAFTFALVWVFLVPLLTLANNGRLWQGLIMSGIYAGGIMVVGGVLIAALNPAATIGFVVSGKLQFSTAILYIFIQILAAVTVALSIEHIFPPKDRAQGDTPGPQDVNQDHL